MMDTDSCHRIQAMCVTEDDGAKKYLECVGLIFEHETKRMRKDGGSMSFYSVVKK